MHLEDSPNRRLSRREKPYKPDDYHLSIEEDEWNRDDPNYRMSTESDEDIYGYDDCKPREIPLSERYCTTKENWGGFGTFIFIGAGLLLFCTGLSYDPPQDPLAISDYEHQADMMIRIILCIGALSVIPYMFALIYWLREGTARFNEELEANRKIRER